LASIDAFVSLHRAEGFGLAIAEAMALGRPVITTDWSGNTDFTNHDNAALVTYDLIRSKESYGPYPAGTLWAEPNLDDAARQMRRVWVDVEWRSKLGTSAATAIAARLSPEVIGATIKSRLERLSASTRRYTRRRNNSMQTAASLVQGIPPATAFRLVSRDVLRRPLFYAVRAPRVPRLLFSEGFAVVLGRAALSARDRGIDVTPMFPFRRIVTGLRSVFSKAGLRKVMAIRRRR
jgi:hypothetical protein